ncbi:ROK family transcriptional regulator [Microbacterium sp. ZXX196]|uniref:ROK family transcriptional regulator n=1 Tax=Microbacterium sp. ZXX196 TaxID=2609291 RepID=UPI0012B88AD7|nr:ROK family transcriptional regulator [Microbacterium sp. ZXX196]MTE23883.1 ROK family protein [Microbacterium sp. ZXX196]
MTRVPETTGRGPAARAAVRTTNEEVRQQNLATVLGLVRAEGPLSRSHIGSATGLNRSTVTALVTELLELALVREADTAPTGRVGRPSLGVAADDTVAALSIRAEPDAVSVALVGLGGAVHSQLKHDLASAPSPRRFAQVAASLVDAMRADIERHYRLVGAGLAVPGLVDATGSVLVAPPLGWRREAVASRLSSALGTPVAAGNDASVGAMAEARFGIARGTENLLYLSGSAHGVGGGLIMDGTLVRGTSGFAGELGHTVVDPRGRPCACGRRGCLTVEVNPEPLLGLLGRRKLDEDDLDIELGVSRNARVRAELERQVEVLSLALTNFVNAFAPEKVVLAGYLGVLLAASRERLSEAVRVHPVGSDGRAIRLERAQMRSRLMQIGPAELAFARLLADPAGRAPRA